MSLLLPLDVKWPYAKDKHGFPVFGAAAISEDELKSVVVAVNNHERLVGLIDAAVKCHALDEEDWMRKARTLLSEIENGEMG